MSPSRNPHPTVNKISMAIRKQFDQSFCKMIESVAVTNRISWLLFKYRVQDELEIGDIICEGYSRGIQSLESGRAISNIHGWFRSTSQHIVSEKFKAKNRNKKLTDKLIQEYNSVSIEKNVVSCNLEHSRVDALLDKLKQLQPLERKILTLQSQGRSMKQIATELIQDGNCEDDPKIVANITQRASRARKKLREG